MATADSSPVVRAGVIGWPVAHSRSPQIHMAAAAAAGIELDYRRYPVAPGAAGVALAGARTLGLRGLSVTMPHKGTVIPHLDELTDAARTLNAVNCVTVEPDGSAIGDNTDGLGFLLGLEHDSGRTVAGQHVVVLGAGGAARSVIKACADDGADWVSVVARRPDAAAEAALVGGDRAGAADESVLRGADVVVNATPLGMQGAGVPDELPCDPSVLAPEARIVDLVYDPVDTPWLQHARHLGLQAYGGLSMLAGQAAAQFTRWTGREAPISAMFEAAANA